jgi:hypothetical protein
MLAFENGIDDEYDDSNNNKSNQCNLPSEIIVVWDMMCAEEENGVKRPSRRKLRHCHSPSDTLQ